MNRFEVVHPRLTGQASDLRVPASVCFHSENGHDIPFR